MIQKAIIESIIDDYSVKIRIPKYDKMYTDGLTYDELSTGIICSVPGTNISYSVNDIVLVGFENDEIGKPVVLGLLYTDKESDSSINVPQVSNTLKEVESTLNEITNRQYYTHIKYSNDGGITFTSLYDYSDTEVNGNTYYCKNIIIDTDSSFIKWDILDNNNQNSIDKFKLKVILHSDTDTFESEETIIDIPDIYNFSSNLTVDYYITPLQDVNIKDYNISLYTDKNPLGTTEGDFIGIFNSDSYIPSLNPIDYSWLSIRNRIQKFIDEASNDNLERIKTIERFLYGKSIEDKVDTQTGLNSAIEVTSENLKLNKKKTTQLTRNIEVDVFNNAILFNGIALMAKSNGHFSIK